MAEQKVDKSSKAALIKGINSPLGFFVLALSIVEGFLATVLTFANIECANKTVFIWLGCVLFILVIVVVFLLVWFKPENLTFDKEAHLANAGKAIIGSNKQRVGAKNRFSKPTLKAK